MEFLHKFMQTKKDWQINYATVILLIIKSYDFGILDFKLVLVAAIKFQLIARRRNFFRKKNEIILKSSC